MSHGETIAVVGAGGMLGRALTAELARRRARVRALSRDDLDLLQPGAASAAIAQLAPSALINAAAFTDVNGAELPGNRAAVDRLNRDGPAELSTACRRAGARFVHVSTDYVFDGKHAEPYREHDPTAPLQVYGRSKLDGEHAVLAGFPQALIVRTSTLYGHARPDRWHYVGAILEQAARKTRIEVVRLPVASPTNASDLARGVLDLLAVRAAGVVHVVNAGGCSRLELARETVRLAGESDRVEVVERSEPPGTLKRPDNSVLDTAHFAALTGRPMRSWQAALAEYVTGQLPSPLPPASA